jgi:hypothetical protein
MKIVEKPCSEDAYPKAKYQCVSRPGSCRFEWCCGPLCACVLKKPAGTEQEKQDVRVARRRQARWRWRRKNKGR